MIFVYPIGIPLMYLIMLYKNREKLDPQKFFTEMSLGQAVLKREKDVNHLKFLYDAFLPEYYWTEVMECLRKLLLTGFVVFFYEGSGIQIFCSMIISIIFVAIFNNIKPYLMPSNNTFAIFVHFQITFTLACTLLLRMNDLITTSENKQSLQFSPESLSMALLISNASVLFFGLILIGRSCFNTSEGNFLDVGFDEHYEEYHESKHEEENGNLGEGEDNQQFMMNEDGHSTSSNLENQQEPSNIEDPSSEIEMINPILLFDTK